MPVEFVEKPKGSKLKSNTEVAKVESMVQFTSGIDAKNRHSRTPLAWLTDASPSLTGFTDLQLQKAVSVVDELRRMPETARSVMMNVIQIGTPPAATGFFEIAQMEIPKVHAATSTPLHSALDRATQDLGILCSDLRSLGIERTDSVVIITTDGHANSASQETLSKSIDEFLRMGKKWSVTNLVVGIGDNLNEEVLQRLANGVPPLRIDGLNGEMILPFIRNIARSVSVSRRGQKIQLELPEGIKPIK